MDPAGFRFRVDASTRGELAPETWRVGCVLAELADVASWDTELRIGAFAKPLLRAALELGAEWDKTHTMRP